MRRLREPVEDGGGAGPAAADDGSLPLVNIAFLLLAFFVIAGAVAAGDPFPVAPPDAGAPALERSAGRELLVAADGSLALDGDPVTPEALGAALAAAPLAGGGTTQRSLRLRADRGADAGRLMQLLGRLRAAGVQDVTLVTVTPAPHTDPGRPHPGPSAPAEPVGR